MTYSILSLNSGNILESYRSEQRAIEAAARILESEPTAEASFALVTFDDEGMPVESVDGSALAQKLRGQIATTA